MFLGILDFSFCNFSWFGFIGYIIIFSYVLFILYHRKNKNYKFSFSVALILVYCFIIFLLKLLYNLLGLTFLNILWFIPFLLCIIVESIIYFVKKTRKIKDKNKKEDNNDV